MPNRLSKITKSHLEKCRMAATAAVDVYNRPGPGFKTALYVVLIVLAWQAFFHAYFYKNGRNPWYHSRTSNTKKGVRYQRIDGEPKHWDLSRCLAEYFGGNQPSVRKNLEFLLGLRNKIEHRHLPDLDPVLYGECQASLMNLEDYLVNEFGIPYGMSDSLAVSLQFSRVSPPEKMRARERLSGTAKTVIEYVERFRGGLTDLVLNDIGYSYRVFLIPRVANRKGTANAAIEFVPMNAVTDEEIERLKKLSVLIKEKHIPIANLDLSKPGVVVDIVSANIPFRFNMHHHTMAWKYFRVRPTSTSKSPENTDQSFCVFDKAHSDYLYKKAWIDKLTRELSDRVRFRAITQQDPQMP